MGKQYIVIGLILVWGVFCMLYFGFRFLKKKLEEESEKRKTDELNRQRFLLEVLEKRPEYFGAMGSEYLSEMQRIRECFEKVAKAFETSAVASAKQPVEENAADSKGQKKKSTKKKEIKINQEDAKLFLMAQGLSQVEPEIEHLFQKETEIEKSKLTGFLEKSGYLAQVI